jgi:hypothetical protein
MTSFALGSLRNTSVWGVFRMREQIDLDPLYQREGNVWTQENNQNLIDTIINGFDVPKIYMHKFSTPNNIEGRQIELAVIDGKQRLSAIWAFIQGKFALKKDFDYIKDDSISAGGFTYAELAASYPDIKADFDAYTLDVVTIETDDIEIIEDMFSRLNEAMPLNAAEKRNAFGGPLPLAVRDIANLALFTQKIPFSNRRYRHYDIAAKMLFQIFSKEITDTKKAYVDKFFRNFSDKKEEDILNIKEVAVDIAESMENIFVEKDKLLRSVGMVMLYFLAFKRARDIGIKDVISRDNIEKFEKLRIENRESAEKNIDFPDYELLEFDRYTQSPNDAVALRFRLGVLDRLAFQGALGLS